LPYQGDTTPAASTPKTPSILEAPGTPAKTPTVPVIPAVDLFLGTVTITTKARTGKFAYPEPQLIAQALAKAILPTRWCEASRTLTVTVAAVGKRAGLQRHFTLSRDHPS
jgi:hypothetical protein